jgi:hypothetical protein
MSITLQDARDRLDSWKSIAAYLDRDERTVQRWERELGLPVRRVPGGRGRSVFAYPAEIDVWLKTKTGDEAEPETATVTAAPVDLPDPVAATAPVRAVAKRAWRRAAVAAALVLAAAAWWLRPTTASVRDLRIETSADGVSAFDTDGVRLWRYQFPADYHGAPAEDMSDPTRVTGGDHPDVYVATAFRDRRSDGVRESGALTQIGGDGRAERSFSFADTVTFDGVTYGPPWIVTYFAVDGIGGARRIAVAAHHAIWDASIVTVLDASFQRRGTFVHAGWIEELQWLAPDRLLIAGFSNAHDGGMVALLDPTRPGGIDGQGPEPPGTHYYCESCAPGAPLRMVVMPRTELNRVTASRFNRARIQVMLGRIFARTIEVPAAGLEAVDALYEFTPSLDLVRAAYGDHYWQVHRVLETEGKLQHSREQSPDKDGPREVQVWTPDTGWRALDTRRPAPAAQ